MDIFFQDPSDVPVPPQDVRIRQFQVEPWADGRRVSVYLELSPFQQKPNGEIRVTNAQGDEIANLSIIETADPRNEFTIHLRGAEIGAEYTAHVNIFYVNLYQNGEANTQTQEAEVQIPAPRFMIVDKAHTSFRINN